MVEEVPERGGRPKTASVLTVHSVHGLEEEDGEPAENLEEVGDRPRGEEGSGDVHEGEGEDGRDGDNVGGDPIGLK